MPAKRNKRNKKRTPSGDSSVAEMQAWHKLSNFFEDDAKTILVAGVLLVLILIGTIWRNRFLPMQDYPQHLYMAKVANTYDDPDLGWAENLELRNQFGPYRALFLAQRALGAITDLETSGKILATIYVLLVGLLAYRVFQESGDGVPRWGALLFFPLCLHPMYFYGFFNFTFSIPVLLLALLDMKALVFGQANWKSVSRQLFLQVLLFLLHPYVLLVYIVLAFASVPLLTRNKPQVLRGIAVAFSALFIFLGWSWYSSMITTGGGGFSLSALKPKWWLFEWNLQFLAMSFTGLRFTQNPHWLVAALWATLLLLVLLEFWRNRREYTLKLWFPVLFCMSVAGYFVLPFSITTDARYTFFNVRMAPIFYFLFVPIVATIPIHRFAGRIVLILCLALTCCSASLHDNVAKEIDGYVPIFDKMEKKGAVLLLIGSSHSEYLDPFFYANFHYCFPFYYHVLKGGGVNSDMFNTHLMPVGFKPGRRPGIPPRRELQRWVEHIPDYDYVIVRQMPRAIHLQLEYYGDFLDSVGPWDLYKLKK